MRCLAEGGIRQRLTEVLGTGSLTRPEEAAGRYFYSKKQGAQNQPVVYARDGVNGKEPCPDRP